MIMVFFVILQLDIPISNLLCFMVENKLNMDLKQYGGE